ncbi:MAG: hypothetical protein V1723_01455 [Candidatus Uhrbacteria bacterium]
MSDTPGHLLFSMLFSEDDSPVGEGLDAMTPGSSASAAQPSRYPVPMQRLRRGPPTATTPPAAPRIDPQRERYIAWCAERVSATVADAECLDAEFRGRLRLASSRLLAAARTQQTMALRAAWLEETRRRYNTVIRADFDALAGLAGIARVEPTDAGWSVVTVPLVVSAGGRRYTLGKLELHIARTGQVRVFNQTHRAVIRSMPWDCPAVRDGQLLAPPELCVFIARSVGAQKYADLVRAIMYFCTNEGFAASWVVPIHAWPIVREPAVGHPEGENHEFTRLIE